MEIDHDSHFIVDSTEIMIIIILCYYQKTHKSVIKKHIYHKINIHVQ